MSLRVSCLVFAIAVVVSSRGHGQNGVESVYTDIAGKACAISADDLATGAYALSCPGVGGYRLHVLQDDERSSISIVAPDKRVFPLDYWDVVTHGLSSLGKKAEWRVTTVGGKRVPIGLIVRVNADDQSDPNRSRSTSLLAVAQIRKDKACVVAKLAPSPTANAHARTLADDAGKVCVSADAAGKNPSAE